MERRLVLISAHNDLRKGGGGKMNKQINHPNTVTSLLSLYSTVYIVVVLYTTNIFYLLVTELKYSLLDIDVDT
jgi:hypothetical protein